MLKPGKEQIVSQKKAQKSKQIIKAGINVVENRKIVALINKSKFGVFSCQSRPTASCLDWEKGEKDTIYLKK